MKIDHGDSELIEGQDYVMTLKDSNVLDDQDGDEENPVLENDNLQSAFRQKIKQRKKQQLASLTSSKFLPNEEEENQGKLGILSKYDDVEEVARANKGSLVVGQQATLKNTSNFKKGPQQTLDYTKNIGSDYLEPVAFKKRLGKRPKPQDDDLLLLVESGDMQL